MDKNIKFFWRYNQIINNHSRISFKQKITNILENIYIWEQKEVKKYIYFLIDNDICVYIGQTLNLESRINTHKKDKIFNLVYVHEPKQKDRIDELELDLIEIFHPKYNKTGKNGLGAYSAAERIKNKSFKNLLSPS